MKVLFLDFDGVLNTEDYREVHGSSNAGIDKSKLPLLKKLVDSTNVKIVLSTSLRMSSATVSLYISFNSCNLNRISQIATEYSITVADR